MSAKFNDKAIDEIARSARTLALQNEIAEEVAATARSTARVNTGAYRDGIVVRTRQAAHRTIVEVVATDPKSMLEESITGNLARAAAAVFRG